MKPPRLSTGQRRALLGLPVNREFTPKHTGFQWPTLACLKAMRLINSVKDGIPGCGPDAKHVVTARGKEVRAAILQAQPPERQIALGGGEGRGGTNFHASEMPHD